VAGDGVRRRWPRQLGETRLGSKMLGNKRAGEVCGCLRVLPKQLVGGEHERWALAPSGGGNGWGEHAVARGGGGSGFYMRLGMLVDDGG
jgi:hypothetical protein